MSNLFARRLSAAREKISRGMRLAFSNSSLSCFLCAQSVVFNELSVCYRVCHNHPNVATCCR